MRNFWSKLKPTKQTPSTNLLQLYQQSPNLKPHPNQLETIKLFQQINTALSTSSRPSKAGIYLWGGVGTGKTMLMDLFYHSLTNVTKKRIHFHPFMRDIHRRIHLLKQQRTHLGDPIIPIVDQLVDEAKVFCFDELQVTDISDAMILRRLFTELFTRDTIIITTSNRHPDDRYKNGIQRDSFLPTIELLKERLIVHCLDTKDYRRESKSTH
jgi:peroxisome-assembly ATPase